MTLWALAMDDDEPERHVPPLSVEEFPSEVPEWYEEIVRICLSPRPRDRLSAKELVDLFPEATSKSCEDTRPHQRPALQVRTMKKYIDPADAVERDDILRLGTNLQDHEVDLYSPKSSRDDYTFTYPKSSNYEFESDLSGYDRPRGRRPPSNYAHLGSNESHHWEVEDERPIPQEEFEPNIVAISPGMDQQFDEVDMDGHRYLITHRTFNDEELEILERQPEAENKMPATGDSATEADQALTIRRPIPARRPSLPAATSATSGSTPRNSQDMLAAMATPTAQHAAPLLEEKALDDIQEAINPKNPKTNHNAPQTDLSITADDGLDLLTPAKVDGLPAGHISPAPSIETGKPPSLPFADSGFDEPLKHLVPDTDVEPEATILEDEMPQSTQKPLPVVDNLPLFVHHLGQETDEVAYSVQPPRSYADKVSHSVQQAEQEHEEVTQSATQSGQLVDGSSERMDEPDLLSEPIIDTKSGAETELEARILPEAEPQLDDTDPANAEANLVDGCPVKAGAAILSDDLDEKHADVTLLSSNVHVVEARPHEHASEVT